MLFGRDSMDLKRYLKQVLNHSSVTKCVCPNSICLGITFNYKASIVALLNTHSMYVCACALICTAMSTTGVVISKSLGLIKVTHELVVFFCIQGNIFNCR